MKNSQIKSLLNADERLAQERAAHAKKTALLHDAQPPVDRSNRQRHALAFRLRQQGMTFKAIANQLGLKCAEGARILVCKGERAHSTSTDSIRHLSVRAQNAILNTGKLPDSDRRWSIPDKDRRDYTRAEIRELISLDDLSDMPNCGLKTFVEIRNWLQKSS